MLNIILTVVFIALVYSVILLLAKINERVRDFRGESLNYLKLSKSNAKYFTLFGIAFLSFFAFCFYYLKYASLPISASYTGQKIDNLFYVTAVITGVVFLLCHIALFAFVYLYYQRKNRKAVFFAHSSTLEIIWTSVPALTMTVLVILGLNVWFQVFPNSKKAPVNPLNIEVTGKQFNWIVRYPGPDGKLGRRLLTKENVTQDNELGIDWSDPASHDDFFASEIHMIKDKPVLFNLSALDVLHSFYLPHFRLKMDCVPGIPTSIGLTPAKTNEETREELKSNPYWAAIDPETNEPRFNKFSFELACAELCGKSHYGMQMNVKVESKSDFDKWTATQKPYYDQIKDKLKPASAPVEEALDLSSLSTAIDTSKVYATDGIQFDPSSYVLNAKAMATLDQIVAALTKNTSNTIVLTAHTDSDGDDAANQKLSQARADACKKYIESKGIDPSKVVAKGMGESTPVASNETAEGKKKNRRTEFNFN